MAGRPGPNPSPHNTLNDAFRSTVAAAPSSIAVIGQDTTLSYADVDRAAGALATCLREAGLTAGDVVALRLPRSADLVVGSVAAVKAGLPYVCIDPASPAERQRRTLERTGARAVVVSELPGPDGVTAIPVRATGTGVPPGPVGGPAGPRDLAVVILTSGSTGEPRAVMLEHRDVVRAVCEPEVRLARDDRVLLLAAVGFDASTFEVWATLANGGTLVVVPSGTPTASEIAATIARHRVSGMLITAALFRILADSDLAALGSLRWVLVGGEELPARHASQFLSAHPECALFNCYGPTETAVIATWFRVPVDCVSPVPIGTATFGKRVYILDSSLRPCAAGEVGEIYISGAGVSRGYLAAPARTAERFVPDPRGESGDRMYRTGDLGRCTSNGVIEFAGRADRQVKVSGFRVEPGEVETVLVQHPAVLQAAVTAAERPNGQTILCAYVVPGDRYEITTTGLREWLGERLPTYLVPARFKLMAQLPLTDHGKIDRASLPAPWQPRPVVDVEFAPATTWAQRELVDVWSDVLGVREIGIDDNFFELGGDSLAGVEMLALASRVFGCQFSARDLIENQTVGELAGLAERRASRSVTASAGAVRTEP